MDSDKLEDQEVDGRIILIFKGSIFLPFLFD